jgi:Ran GTPase-activating protein (RanGAP) involved in mRNA processing and transport
MKSTFEEIILSDNKIGNEGAKWLMEGLMGNTSVKKLYAARCEIKAEGFKYMGKLLGDCPSLEEVILSSNDCDNGLYGEFCEGLAKNKNLKSLYLGVCRLRNDGIKPLCQGPLKIHPALQHLSLTYNRLEAASVKYLNEALAANKVLKYLDLSGNSLGPEGARELVKGLKANKGNLEKLSLAQNEIRHSGCRDMTMFFLSTDGQKMEFCDLRHNLITFQLMIQLRNEIGRPLPGDNEKADEEGWLLLFNGRQIFLNAH